MGLPKLIMCHCLKLFSFIKSKINFPESPRVFYFLLYLSFLSHVQIISFSDPTSFLHYIWLLYYAILLFMIKSYSYYRNCKIPIFAFKILFQNWRLILPNPHPFYLDKYHLLCQFLLFLNLTFIVFNLTFSISLLSTLFIQTNLIFQYVCLYHYLFFHCVFIHIIFISSLIVF